jgi:steroid 5-alpha reductase family enzyme
MLLLRYVSGVPLLERMAEQRWGSDPAFQAYKARTNLLVPLPPLLKDNHTS